VGERERPSVAGARGPPAIAGLGEVRVWLIRGVAAEAPPRKSALVGALQHPTDDAGRVRLAHVRAHRLARAPTRVVARLCGQDEHALRDARMADSPQPMVEVLAQALAGRLARESHGELGQAREHQRRGSWSVQKRARVRGLAMPRARHDPLQEQRSGAEVVSAVLKRMAFLSSSHDDDPPIECAGSMQHFFDIVNAISELCGQGRSRYASVRS
jgi:hypothetical protein